MGNKNIWTDVPLKVSATHMYEWQGAIAGNQIHF